MSEAMLSEFSSFLDAANIDIKAFQDDTYRRLMGGRLAPVLESCQKMKDAGIWLEITTLIVPGVNDDLEEMKALARFIHDQLGAETPWHLSRFYPQYKMRATPPTDENFLSKLKDTGHDLGLAYVYLGNVIGSCETLCRQCGQVLITRRGYHIQMSGLDNEGHCLACGASLDGVGLFSR
jgi:pyruvate formate lyase activating enzyme